MNPAMTQLCVEVLPDGLTVRLTQPFTVWLGEEIIVVPAGTETDFASVPRALWRILPPWGKYSPAAVVHDYLYDSGIMTRAEADQVFLDLMKALGVPYLTRYAMYWGVRAGGWVSWNKCREAGA
ncbi:DUF1353 domain-containing protein [Desulfosarcina sp. OttesenSCG-928-G10]|nr:DUF1353 domain-containing protein [Desulfosarcina sp. OttesenSCG-928-G10]